VLVGILDEFVCLDIREDIILLKNSLGVRGDDILLGQAIGSEVELGGWRDHSCVLTSSGRSCDS